ncbi:MAG TPA: glycerate kinase [Gemmatimonadota bacterium]|nr:glycerate kinase [Gemmatimonadota bacterium]
MSRRPRGRPPAARLRVVLAPNSFKGTFDAVAVAEAWRGALATLPGVVPVLRPMGDGGDGFLAVVRRYRPHVLEVAARVPDPLGRPVAAAWGWDPGARAAYLESAAAIGLGRMAAEERRPLEADSAGLGRLLATAAGIGVRRFLIGLGGSATVDGGLGMARALGFRFEDARGRAIGGPGSLERLARIHPPVAPPLGKGARVTALADVESPLLGPSGAAAVFGPQKGADPEAVARLEAGLARLAERWVADLGAPTGLPEARGAGAAGGLGAGSVAFLGAQLASGAAWCARLAGLGPALAGADLVLTGEGSYDAQSGAGKATGYVVARARRARVPAEVLDGGALEGARPGAQLTLDDLGALARLTVERFGARTRS